MKFWTIPTIMTWTRIIAIPLIVGVFYLDIAEERRNQILDGLIGLAGFEVVQCRQVIRQCILRRGLFERVEPLTALRRRGAIMAPTK